MIVLVNTYKVYLAIRKKKLSSKNIILILIIFYIFTDQIRFYANHSSMIMEHICYVTWKSFLGLTSYLGSLLFLLYICCPFLDVLSCFVTLGGAQYLFGSAACPILYSTKVKQQRWPAEELHISFIFLCVESESRERGYFSCSSEENGSFFRVSK